MPLGIDNNYAIAADIVRTSSAALVTTTLSSPIAANQRQHIKFWIKVTVGATGGVRFQVVVPAGGVLFSLTLRLNNTVAPAMVLAEQQATAAFTNALANAGTHWIEGDATIINGTTPGAVDIQMGQNTSDALSLTILRGGWMTATIL
jgi:hypothetical protein